MLQSTTSSCSTVVIPLPVVLGVQLLRHQLRIHDMNSIVAWCWKHSISLEQHRLQILGALTFYQTEQTIIAVIADTILLRV
jgi:hypothetical protein